MKNRLCERNFASDMVAMTMMLYGIPRILGHIDAFVVLPGLGEHWRLLHAIKKWQSGATHARYLFIAGHNQREKMAELFTTESLREPPFLLTQQRGLVFETYAKHTREQGEWLSKQIRKYAVESVGLFVSPYHLLRAYCTVLKTLVKENIRIPIIPVPVAVSPKTKIPETQATAWDMVPGEMHRIAEYQEVGDVATYEELRKYIEWMWNVPPLSHCRPDS